MYGVRYLYWWFRPLFCINTTQDIYGKWVNPTRYLFLLNKFTTGRYISGFGLFASTQSAPSPFLYSNLVKKKNLMRMNTGTHLHTVRYLSGSNECFIFYVASTGQRLRDHFTWRWLWLHGMYKSLRAVDRSEIFFQQEDLSRLLSICRDYKRKTE